MFKARGKPIPEQDTDVLLEVREELLDMLENEDEAGNEQDLFASIQICDELDDRGVKYPEPMREIFIAQEMLEETQDGPE